MEGKSGRVESNSVRFCACRSAFLARFSHRGEIGDCKEGGFDSQAVEGLLFLRAGGVGPGSLFASARLDHIASVNIACSKWQTLSQGHWEYEDMEYMYVTS